MDVALTIEYLRAIIGQPLFSQRLLIWATTMKFYLRWIVEA